MLPKFTVDLSWLTGRKKIRVSGSFLPSVCLPGSGGRAVARFWLSKEDIQVAKKAAKKKAKKAAKKKGKK